MRYVILFVASVSKPQSSATVSMVMILSTISFLVNLIGLVAIFQKCCSFAGEVSVTTDATLSKSERQHCILGSLPRPDSEHFHLSKGSGLKGKELSKCIAASELKNDRRGEEGQLDAIMKSFSLSESTRSMILGEEWLWLSK